MSLPDKVRSIKPEPDTYHGVPVLALRAGDPVPVPRAPERYAVRVYPDLARHLLGLNHGANRHIKPRTVARYAADMRDGLWWFTPEPIVFSASGVLQNGQHRLVAVCEYGSDVWMMVDLGWPDSIINAIDRGAARSNADAFTVERLPHATTIPAALSLIEKYDLVMAAGGSRSFVSLPSPSAQHCLAAYRADPDGWGDAARHGKRVYDTLDKSFGAAIWVAAYRLVADVHPDRAEPFYSAVASGSDPAGSASRALADWARRRPARATRTGDSREPLEVIIRGFNAWAAGRSMSFPKAAGFTMCRVR